MVILNRNCTTICLHTDVHHQLSREKTPAELFLGRKLKSTLDLIKPDVSYFECKFIDDVKRNFSVNEPVLVRVLRRERNGYLESSLVE